MIHSGDALHLGHKELGTECWAALFEDELACKSVFSSAAQW